MTGQSQRRRPPTATTREYDNDHADEATSSTPSTSDHNDHGGQATTTRQLRRRRRRRQTYFDAERTRTDPIVALNLLRLFYSRGCGHELSHTLDWLLCATLDPNLHARLARLLRARIEERTDAASGDALAGSVVGLRLAHGLALLLPPQCEDGVWGASWMYKYGSSGVKIGNRGLTTALALNAISALQSPPQPQPPEPLWTLEKRRLLPVGLPLSLPPPLLPVKDKKEWTCSVGTVVKAIYAYVFVAGRTSTRRLVQDPGVDVRPHERGGSIGA
ncbi:hypothetical protein EDB84DRAFT_1565257 [Lactarius hengduanensis]|nr:hypothetical protein EDB84DRAFT_1565257 [Lactarius hengduanensis]